MLTEYLGIQRARYSSLTTVNHDELKKAQMVEIDEFVPEGIYHSSKLNWKGDLTFFNQPEDFIRSAKERQNLSVSRNYFLQQGYTISVTEVDEELNHQFMEVYRQTTLKRDRAVEYDTELLVKKNMKAGIPVYLFGLYKDAVLESGLLVSEIKDELRVMFGAKKKFPEIRGGIGGVLEMELLTFAFKHNNTSISHGISTNPAGIIDKAGIFEFKSRYGFTAFPFGEWRTTFILDPSIAQSDMVFLTIQNNQLCHSILYLTEEVSLKKYKTRFITAGVQESIHEHARRAKLVLGV